MGEGRGIIDPAGISRVYALAPNWLGDVAMCTPALRALKRRFSQASLTVSGPPGACALLEGLPWIDALEPFSAKPGLGTMLRLLFDLKAGPGLCVVFPHSFRAALVAWCLHARHRVGYARGGRGFLLTQGVAPHRSEGRIQPVYMAEEYLGLVRPLGCEDAGPGLELHADPGEREAVGRMLAGEGPLVGIAPGAAFGPSKRWLPERYAAVADALAREEGARCVLITGPGEEETRAQVLAAAKTPLLEASAGGRGIARLKAIIASLDLLVGNDSGPRHIAIAFQKPVICIMGSTSPAYTDSPWERGQVLRVDVDCGPCQKPVCTTDHRCMTGVGVEAVVQAARAWLPR